MAGPKKRGRIVIHVPDTISVWIDLEDYTDNIIGYEFFERFNEMGEFNAELVDISDSDRSHVAEGKEIQFRLGNTLIFKGEVERCDYKTNGFCSITGFGYVESKMKKTSVSSNHEATGCDPDSPIGRPFYGAASEYVSGVSSTRMISGQLSVVSNVSLGVNKYLGHGVVRSDEDNVLSFADSVVRMFSGVWWTSYGSYPYDSNYFNVAQSRGSGSSVKTYVASGNNQNVIETSREVDWDNLWNSVTVLGYGDGVNQLRSKAYHATDNFTRLAEGCSETDTVINVENGSVLPDSGNIWIGMESGTIVSKSGNAITVTRAKNDGTDGFGQDYLKAYAHSKGVIVMDMQYSETSTDGNSRIDADGLRQKTIIDKRIVDQDSLDLRASNALIEHWDKKEYIRLEPDDFYDCLKTVSVGDIITISDSESGLSGDYTVVGRRVTFNGVVEKVQLEATNAAITASGSTKPSLTTDLKDTKDESKVQSGYMQGSTAVFNVSMYENCDQSNPLNIRFYLPSDIVRINKALLNFKVKNYRAYVVSSLSDPGHTHTVFIGPSGTHDHTVSASGSHTHTVGGTFNANTPTTSIGFDSDHKLCDGQGHSIGDIGAFVASSGSHTHSITAQGEHTHAASAGASSSYTGVTQNYGIDESAGGSDATIDIAVGLDGSETIAYTNKSVSGVLAIDTWLVSGVDLKAGNWMNVKITPNKKCRIEGSVFIKCFIEAK